MRKYFRVYNFHKPWGHKEALRRVASIFTEIDLFDLRYQINTRTIREAPYQNSNYMPYWPVFTSVAREMIRQSYNFYRSGIRYSNYERKCVFVDLGAGAGKTPIMAAKTKKFELSVGIELEPHLHVRFQNNVNSLDLKSLIYCSLGNVENPDTIKEFALELQNRGFTKNNTTLFLFNKNSYSKTVLENSLKLLGNHFTSLIYLYQNPVHHETLLSNGFKEFGRDSQPNNAHKNYKYVLYHK
jgi:hypothetical protein